MIDVTVKTLDSQNHVFSVEEDISVKQFKEKISPTINIPVDQQRLIFRGRVLQDDKKLSEYNVANNVVHVVQRPSNQNSTANDEPRPSNPAGHPFPDDGMGGAGRNAIIMGAIGLPTFGMDGEGHDGDGGHPVPRRSGATIRLLLGNQMLNRASNLLQQLEDGSAAAATNPSASSSSSGTGVTVTEEVIGAAAAAGLDNANNIDIMDMDIDFEDEEDPGSIERMISQVVNVSSAAALVAAIRQVNPGATGAAPAANNESGGSAATTTPSQPAPATGSATSASGPNPATNPATGQAATGGGGASSTASPARNRPENPRLRELATALQDLLALQDRLNPYLRFLQDALRQNRLYSEPGETQSTQFLYNTVSNILHLLSHSLHSFSDITCDFSVAPNDRRLVAPSSILVEQSTVVRATIPVAVPAMLAQAAAANSTANNNNVSAAGQATGVPPPSAAASATGNSTNANAQQPQPLPSTPLSLYGGRFPGISISIGGAPRSTPVGGTLSYPFTMPMTVNASAVPGMANAQPWRNPNLQRATTPQPQAQQTPAPGQVPTAQQQQQQQQQNNGMGMNFGNAVVGGVINAQQLANLLPPGLQNFGALLGMPTANGVQIVGGLNPQGGLIPPQQPANAPQGQQPQQPNASNPSSASATAPGATPNGVPNGNIGAGADNHGAGMFQNLLRNEMNRPQFDPILPCHSHHSNASRSSRSNRNNSTNNPPPEFKRFVNVEQGPSSSSDAQGGSSLEEAIEILIDFVRNSRLVDMLQPLVKDVVLNYLMRGRDSKNEAHVRTCAKGLAKKILPFFEKFSTKAGGKNEDVDISATYSNILTSFLASLMQKAIGASPCQSQFKLDVLNGLNDLQKQLIRALKVCHPNATNVGLLFVNHLVDQFLGGMSILFKTQVRHRLVEHLKQLESAPADDQSSSQIVYKQVASEAPVKSQPAPSTSSSSSVGNAPSLMSSSSAVSSRCAASFGNLSCSSGAAEASSSAPKKKAAAPSSVTDDVDIDEVLQLPASMSSTPSDAHQSNPRESVPGAGHGHGHGQPDANSLYAALRSLPSEWASTIEEDIMRQVEMPAQPSFSPGFNTLFPRKH